MRTYRHRCLINFDCLVAKIRNENRNPLAFFYKNVFIRFISFLEGPIIADIHHHLIARTRGEIIRSQTT